MPAAAQSIMVYTMLDTGTAPIPAKEKILLPLGDEDPYTVGLRLAAPLDGDLVTSAGVFDPSGCLLAAGDAVTKVTVNDGYREIQITLEPQPLSNKLGCQPEDPQLFSVTPTQILTTGRDALRNPVPLHLSGWGFRPNMQVTVGRRLQPTPRILSFRKAVIDVPVVARELGPTSVTLDVAGFPPANLDAAITVMMTPIVTSLNVPATPATTNSLLDIAVGDFDRDGKPDVALLDSMAVVSFYDYQTPLGLSKKSDRVMLAASGISMPNTGSILSGDLDGDGTDDLVVVTPSGSAVLKGQPGGPLAILQAVSGIQGRDAALADMNGDGRLDLVRAGAELAVHLNTGNGTFALAPSLQVAMSGDAVRVADLNRDSRPDVVATTPSGDLVALINEQTQLQPRLSYPVRGGCSGASPGLVIAELDDDGAPDVVVNGVSALLLDPAGAFNLQYIDSVPICFGGVAITAADLNSDGVTDLAWVRSLSTILLPSAGRGHFFGQLAVTMTTPSLEPPVPPLGPRHIPAADLNGDGTKDLIIGHAALLTAPQ